MRHAPRPEVVRSAGYDLHIVGSPRPGMADVYHALLTLSWWSVLGVVAAGYLGLNVVFASAFLLTGGIANARPHSFLDAFFFSVQTMGTIGYGTMYPASIAANTVVVVESIVGLVVTALATGLVFVRFSRVRPRVAWSRQVALGLLDGAPTLMVRVGNERRNRIVDAVFRMALIRTARTAEGVTWYRTDDLVLARDRAPSLSRSWTLRHVLTPASPLYGETPESLTAADAELLVSLSGTDDTTLQPVHASFTWAAGALAWGVRLADILQEMPDGNLRVDLNLFHDVTPTEATGDFPYPRAP